jgi:glycerol-3-phosphate O-acyltransferase
VLLLAPGMRWFFRRRINAVIQELNTRLRIELPSFKLTRREVLIDRLFHDAAHAGRRRGAGQGSRRAAGRRAPPRRPLCARDRAVLQRLSLLPRRLLAGEEHVARLLYRVRLGYADEAGLAAVAPKSTVVFVMNHRSNMDYVLVAFLAAEQVALSYAVGEWARIWGLQALIRSMGAYFVRRNSGDPLYRTVLSRYVAMATEAGVPQALFPEGGLTVDGALRPPKFGLLDYMVKSFRPDGERDLVFIPVGLNYDRVLEDRSQLLKLEAQRRRRGLRRRRADDTDFRRPQPRPDAHRPLAPLRLRLREFRQPAVDARATCSAAAASTSRGLDEAARKLEVAALGRRLMQAIGGVDAGGAGGAGGAGLRAAIAARALSELEIKSAAFALLREWEARGAHIYVPRHDQDYAIGVGLRMLTLRRIVEERDGLYCAGGGKPAGARLLRQLRRPLRRRGGAGVAADAGGAGGQRRLTAGPSGRPGQEKREAAPVVLPNARPGEAGLLQQRREAVGRPLVRILGVDALAGGEAARLPGQPHLEVAARLQVHLDAARRGVEEGDMPPVGDIEVGRQQAVHVAQHVQVEGGGDAERVVVGGLQCGLVLDQVDADQ